MKHRVLAGAALVATLTTASAVPATAFAEARSVRRPLTGEAVYFDYNKKFSVDRYVPGSGFVRLGNPSENFQFAASPDGRKLAWITLRGEVKVKVGGKVTTAAKGVPVGAPCLTPTWSPDSKRLAYVSRNDDGASPVTIVNADGTGLRKAGKTVGVCHLAWSGDGRYLAGYAGAADAVYKLDVTTGKSAKVKGIAIPTHVQSLSPDGRNVIVEIVPKGADLGDGGWPSGFTPTIVDTVTGKKVAIPVKGRLLGAFYLADARLVVRVAGTAHNALVVLDETGKQLQRLDEPAKAQKQGLLQVVR